MAACVQVGREAELSAGRAADEAGRRLALEVPRPAAAWDDGQVAPGVSELLADELSEESAVKIALLNNRSVRASFEELAWPRPSSTRPAWSRTRSSAPTPSSSSTAPSSSRPDAVLPRLLRRPLRRSLAETELAVRELHVELRLVELVYDVRRAFVVARAAAQLAEMRASELAAAQAARDLMAGLHDAGNVTELDLAVQEEALSEARLS
jgi:cobalt-zinc-cadmium efflux system outer membrane protein